jgi:putrescine transport system ATP-binding protein
VQVATPSEIYEQPNSRYVADFIGDINLIEGKVAVAGPTIRLESPSVCTVEVEDDAAPKAGDTAWFAIRPEKVRIGLDPPPAVGINTVSGKVWDIGYIGDTSIYHVKLESGVTMRATVANTSRLIDRPISWEDTVWLSWSRDAGIVLTR